MTQLSNDFKPISQCPWQLQQQVEGTTSVYYCLCISRTTPPEELPLVERLKSDEVYGR